MPTEQEIIDDRWDLMTNPKRDLEWAIRGVEAQSRDYCHFLDGLQKRREERRLELPQFPVELHLPEQL